MFMQPQQTPPPAPPPAPIGSNSGNPYEFITNPQKPTKNNLFSGMNNKVLMIAAVLLGITVIVLIFAVVFGSQVSNKDQLISLAKKQNELVRVAGIGEEKARTTEAKNLAATAKLTFSSQQQPLLDTLAKQGIKLKGKQLNASTQEEIDNKNAADKKLTEAEQNNRFDDVFLVVLRTQLAEYQKDLKAAYDNTSNKSIKNMLSEQYKSASLFIDQETSTN